MPQLTDHQAWQWLLNGLRGLAAMIEQQAKTPGSQMTPSQCSELNGELKRLQAVMAKRLEEMRG
ncbi:MAG: hypothetical protein A3F84_27760 [Candidatus Handelsmanbacteria bacterium RIFCSPLOWO2_12_FULL_64_10]|uniref:Uncharacterized protein n=1 Tax=Handelsmanbacteria sp. (strain RIFCSPLOWO2_12_FULL_64_10) TaxID=1817868 RepID=A0A1F6C4M2_HANXR|nr:MAG: hypothetical protein A3F84_27760 [Candidatus Handelsmanbacteria bacterium RIFCSPLOWO2_12_FULL_64_10]